MFLVKREELRDFDVVFFFFFWGVFCVWKRGETLKNHPGRAQDPGSLSFFWVWRVLGAFSSPDTLFKATAL